VTNRRERLHVLYTSIDARVAATHAASTEPWPCTAGCDACCHKLSKIPEITDVEWHELAAAIARVPAHQALFAARIDALDAAASLRAVSSPPTAVPGGRAAASLRAVSSPPTAVPGGRAAASDRAGSRTGPVVCPFLAPEDGVARPGSCLVYDGRPAACRTYGYYAERGDLLGCATILAHDNDGAAGVVWGNQLAVDRELDALCSDTSAGRRSIVARFQERFR